MADIKVRRYLDGWRWECARCGQHSIWKHWRLAMRDAEHHAKWHVSRRHPIPHDIDYTPPGGTRRLIP